MVKLSLIFFGEHVLNKILLSDKQKGWGYISMKERILLIEDDQDHVEIITSVIKEDDAKNIKTEVISKKDGQEAIDYFQYEIQPQVSLVILDLKLPKIDGMDVLKFIKKDAKYCSIPVVILSTSSHQETIDEAYRNGATDYFIKPNTYDEFVAKIKILKKCR